MRAGSRGSVTSSQFNSKSTSADAEQRFGMAPVLIEPAKRNEVVMTREEAQKKKAPKGYAFVPVVPTNLPAAPISAADVADGRRTRHGQPKRLDNSSSGRLEMKAFPEQRGQSVVTTEHTATLASTDEARGQKRKLASLNSGIPQELGLGTVGSEDGTNGAKSNPGQSIEEKRRKKEEKRKQRERLLEELKRIEQVNAKIEEREQTLRSKVGAAGSESAGESNRVGRRSANGVHPGGAGGRWGGGMSIEVPNNRFGMDETGLGETAQSAPPASRAEMTRQASLQYSDATPGFKEKRTPKANSAYINQDFVSGQDKLPPPEKAKSRSIGVKRGLITKPGESRSAKRARVEAARARRSADILKMCTTVLKKLLVHKWAWVFDKPVDAVALNLPDYHSVIKEPMDLGTVNKRLKGGEYLHATDFARDVRLTFTNAMAYNGQSSDVYIMADELKKLFESHYKKVAEKVREEELRIAEEEDELNSDPKEKEVEELQKRLKRLESQVERKDKKPGGASKGGGKNSSLPRPRKEDTEKRPMTFEEKRKLSVNLGKLPGDKLGKIVQIISSNQPNLTHEDDEIELDIDSLDNDTLWELERYVANVMKSKGKQKRRSGEDEHAYAVRTGEVGGESSSRRGEGEDEVDIDDDQPTRPVTRVEVDTDEKATKSSSSSSSSDDSGSSSSDSESGSGSSGSDSENEDAQSKEATSRASREKEPAGSGAAQERKSISAAKTDGGKKHMRRAEEEVASKSKDGTGTKARVLGAEPDPPREHLDEGAEKPSSGGARAEDASEPHAASENNGSGGCEQAQSEGPVPPSNDAAMRAALLRGRYADSILNAKKKVSMQPSKNAKLDPKKLEEMERKQREERSRLAKEALAAQEARNKQEELLQAELRRKREEEREAARRALHEMERTVNLDENSEILQDLHQLNVAHGYPPPVNHAGSPEQASRGMPQLTASASGYLLNRIGLVMREDYDEGEEGEEGDDDDDHGFEEEDLDNGHLTKHGDLRLVNGDSRSSEDGYMVSKAVLGGDSSEDEDDGAMMGLPSRPAGPQSRVENGDVEEGEIGEAGEGEGADLEGGNLETEVDDRGKDEGEYIPERGERPQAREEEVEPESGEEQWEVEGDGEGEREQKGGCEDKGEQEGEGGEKGGPVVVGEVDEGEGKEKESTEVEGEEGEGKEDMEAEGESDTRIELEGEGIGEHGVEQNDVEEEEMEEDVTTEGRNGKGREQQHAGKGAVIPKQVVEVDDEL